MLAGIVGIGSVAAVGGSATVAQSSKPMPPPELTASETPAIVIEEFPDEEKEPLIEPATSFDETESVEPDSIKSVPAVDVAITDSDELPNPVAMELGSNAPVSSELPLAKTAAASEYREFSDASGKFRVKAQFLGLYDGKVKLKKADGSEIEVPLVRLSDGDIAWIKLQSNR